MRRKKVSAISLVILSVIGIIAFAMALYAQSVSWRFLLALYPLIVILFGVAFLRQSGLTMAFVGLILTIVLAVFSFRTPIDVAFGSSVYGFLKSFGISFSVVATMLMIFLMREADALETVSKVIKQQVAGKEVQALYIGVGFGSFLTSLGVVTPALFPPLLMTMGFSPASSIAIAVLGYDPTTSFSLLSIPITLPAEFGKTIGIPINPVEFAFKISIFLPLVSTGFAYAILWLVGGKRSMRKVAVPATICGLTLALACLGAVSLDYFIGVEYIPLRIVGVIAGLCVMIVLYLHQKLNPQTATQQPTNYPSRKEILRSFSPWIILTTLAVIVSVPQIGSWLSKVPGSFEKVIIFANQIVDFDVLSQIYTWIFVAVFLSAFTLRMTRKQVRKAVGFWLKRFLGPFLAYSLYFSIAFVMANSAMVTEGGVLTAPEPFYSELNMNVIFGSTLAALFGVGYIFVASSLGLFGAVVGGSETSSNVLFLKIQKTATDNIGLNSNGFMTVYGSHAVAGGIASAVTPAKINNAVVTIDERHETESTIMRKHLIVVMLLTIATGILTGIFVNLNI